MIGLAMMMMLAGQTDGISPSQGFVTGNKLLTWCEADRQLCGGYVQGVIDTWIAEQSFKRVGRLVCLRQGVTAGQVVDVALAYLRAHPETRDLGASGLVVVAIGEAFPCPKP